LCLIAITMNGIRNSGIIVFYFLLFNGWLGIEIVSARSLVRCLQAGIQAATGVILWAEQLLVGVSVLRAQQLRVGLSVLCAE
jgi:hypothetical protein